MFVASSGAVERRSRPYRLDCCHEVAELLLQPPMFLELPKLSTERAARNHAGRLQLRLMLACSSYEDGKADQGACNGKPGDEAYAVDRLSKVHEQPGVVEDEHQGV